VTDRARPARKVSCPGCGAATEFSPANPWRPFCSERCRLIDLGGWASEAYRVPVRPDPGEEEGKEPGPGDGRPLS
jgi:endogenous inhibitor of DNA gyrase (YacG/DUF329 family)